MNKSIALVMGLLVGSAILCPTLAQELTVEQEAKLRTSGLGQLPG
jgi:hypothetical protein